VVGVAGAVGGAPIGAERHRSARGASDAPKSSPARALVLVPVVGLALARGSGSIGSDG
jgi:hypothetical protein